MTKLGQFVEDIAWNYPSLFGADEHTRLRILDHLFTTYGAGIRWTADGELEDMFPEGRVSQAEHNERLSSFYRHPNRPVYLETLSKHSTILYAPQNITNEYLEAALVLLDTLAMLPAAWFAPVSPTREYPIAEESQAKAIEFREFFRFRFRDRLSAVEGKNQWLA